MAIKNKFKSDLAIAKNLGSSGSGSEHWLRQRVTAILMVLSVVWLFCFARQLFNQEVDTLILVIKKPYNVVMLFLFVVTGFYHASLGMQVIIEDYVTCRFSKITLLLLVKIFSLVTVVSFLVALLSLLYA
jgi:succinate dehydrogenase / fumarate reductase membrane anchor subunit